MQEPSNARADKTLDSWKEIAAFLNRGVRTVQRWEKTEGLPVRRHQHLKRGSICATPSELATWQLDRQNDIHIHTRNHAQDDLGEPFDRLRKLALRQAILAEELRALLSVNQAIRSRMSRLKS